MKAHVLMSIVLTSLTFGCDDAAESAPEDAPQTFMVVVRGPLASEDASEQQTLHDQVAAGGEAAARKAGDLSHRAFVTEPLMGTPAHGFLALDRWQDRAALDAFYANPDFGAALSTLFSAPPTVETLRHADDWYGWGTLDDAAGQLFVVVRGRLAGSDAAAAQAAHDEVAAGGEETVRAAGDLAHVVFIDPDDPFEFMAIDVWGAGAPIEAVYGDPGFQQAFGSLFAAPPSLQVFRATDWHQW
jgi:quinol monooxygenase YgiN